MNAYLRLYLDGYRSYMEYDNAQKQTIVIMQRIDMTGRRKTVFL